MVDIIKNSYKISLIYSFIFFLIGLLLFIDPEGFVIMVSYMISLSLIIAGINNLIRYSKDKTGYAGATLTIAIILLLLGFFLVMKPTFIASIIPLVIGVCLTVSSLEKLISLKYLSNEYDRKYKVSTILGVITLISGILLIFNPFEGTLLVTRIIGMVMITFSVIDIIDKIKLKKGVRDIKKDKDKKIKIIDEK